jgi:hypothetical protein
MRSETRFSAAQTLAAMHPKVCAVLRKAVTALCVKPAQAEERGSFLDHGPLGYLSIAAHGHADANAVTLSLDDRPILVDPGTYLYYSCGKWRDWFRGTRAHNTLNVQGADQSISAAPLIQQIPHHPSDV